MTAPGPRGVPGPAPLTAVLCVRDRAATFPATLESLCAQTLGADAFEVVVVDDGSSDGTREVVRGFERRLRLRYARQRSAGIASARNHGLLCARGHVVLFVDDDIADPGLVAAHLEAHRRDPHPRYAVVGRVRPDASLAADPLMRFLAERGLPPFAPAAPAPGETADWRHVAAGRSSWKRSFLLAHGLFNPALRGGGEGPELAIRLLARGLSVVVEPGATTALARRATLDEALALAEEEGRALRLAAALHPDPAVERWAGIAGAADRWAKTAPGYEETIRSAREVDSGFRGRTDAALATPDAELSRLHRSYSEAFRASRTKGSAVPR